MNIDALLTAENLRVMQGKRNILKDVSLSFFPGLNLIAGLNGSGKSTLIKALCGAIPYHGSVRCAGIPLEGLKPKLRAQKIAVVHQQLWLQFPVTVSDYVLSGRFPWTGTGDVYSSADRQLAAERMAQMHIEEMADRHIDELSGGELQRVLLARALAQNAPVLLLDEPDQRLDVRNRKELWILLRSLAAGGTCVVCATHDMEALSAADVRVVGIKEGRVVADGKGSEMQTTLERDVF